ncbi:phospholipase [Acinetobacter sp. NCu2D-2]|uniref:phospholipase D family protein n=1 Tax=Acinetobacter sp. NCu2D-2 TaxID=1608473 RepID=UPI0007CDAD5F|nr:phospholipase D family protein [Acinetobacter sp. NCu2D-2]ANF81808.1 phospholipase [Acinetobacter sp. NCu2D-2]
MTKLHLMWVALFFNLFLLTGCDLAANTAQSAKMTPIHADHWFTSEKSKQNLQQGQTAYLPLYDGFMSISARLYIINRAKYNLDLQYYIWEDDHIGNLMLSQLLKAADRGVKVKLLIDDQNGTKLDDTLRTLSQHPNFEIRIFNPYKFRHFRVLDYGLRMRHVNHRMHNKLIVADGSVAVTGGRNISSEYFDASYQFQFTDVDIFFAGTAVKDANQSFTQFWNDDLGYDIRQIARKNTHIDDLKNLRRSFAHDSGAEQKLKQRIELAEKEIAKQLELQPVQWAKAHFVADHPNKIRGQAQDAEYIYDQMIQIMGEPQQHLELVSAYFVPTQTGTDYLTKRAKNGLNVRILTNSFLANDVAIVHAYYQQYRKALLESGVQLWEFKPYIERPNRTWYEKMTGNIIPAKNKNSSSLHAKFFDVDGKVFIGSFNFDPRSANLNTEVGLVIESQAIQDQITQNLNHYLPRIAYELKLDKNGEIIWLDHGKNKATIQHTVEPETTKFQRFMINTVAKTPFEWMM